jgi:hypothetical protein
MKPSKDLSWHDVLAFIQTRVELQPDDELPTEADRAWRETQLEETES